MLATDANFLPDLLNVMPCDGVDLSLVASMAPGIPGFRHHLLSKEEDRRCASCHGRA